MKTFIWAASAVILGVAAQASAGNLIANGTFASNNVVNSPSAGESRTFRSDPGASITGWTYVVPGGTGDNNGGLLTVLGTSYLNSSANINDGGATYGLWYPGDWSSGEGALPTSTIPEPPSNDPYVLAQDSAPENTAYLSQEINGLTVGKKYAVTFDFAGVQLRSPDGTNWNGATNEAVEVNLGGTYDIGAGLTSQAYAGGETLYATSDPSVTTYSSPAAAEAAGLQVPEHGFTGWQSATLVFTATATSELLNLEAISSSSNEPPFALIDNVQMNFVPEPATWTVIMLGLGGLGALARRRRARMTRAAAARASRGFAVAPADSRAPI